MKKIVAFLMICTLVFCTFCSCSKTSLSDSLSSFCVCLEKDNHATEIQLTTNKDSREVLYLPSGVDEVYLSIDTASAMLDGDTVKNGDKILFSEGAHTLSCGQTQIDFDVLISDSVHSIFLDVDESEFAKVNEDTEHELGTTGIVSIYSPDGQYDFSCDFSQIRGRGNSTWTAPKKPYQIKFDQKQNLCDMGSSKTWLLLANYFDATLVRNSYFLTISKEMGIDYPIKFVPCDLWACGKYLGSYILCEKVEVADGRVDITSLEKVNENLDSAIDTRQFVEEGDIKYCDSPASPRDITGGYLLEVDYSYRFSEENVGFRTSRGTFFVVKSPDNATKEEVEYIRDFVQKAEDALYATGDEYLDFIDARSFAKAQIIDEISMRPDTFLSSTYIYKDSDLVGDGKLHFAPMWDFDTGSGNTQGSDLFPSDWMWTSNVCISETSTINYYGAALAHDTYRNILSDEIANVTPTLEKSNEIINSLSQTISKSAALNFDRWNICDIIGGYSSPTIDAADYSAHKGLFCDKIDSRVSLLTGEISTGDYSSCEHPRFCDVGDTTESIDMAEINTAVEYAVSNGLFKGTELYIFNPSGEVNTAMLATVFSTFASADLSNQQLPDGLDSSLWYAKYYAWASENGIFPNTLTPDTQITGEILDTTIKNLCDKLAIKCEYDEYASEYIITRADLAYSLWQIARANEK